MLHATTTLSNPRQCNKMADFRNWLATTTKRNVSGPSGYPTAVAQSIRSRITDLAVPVHPY